MKTTHCYFKEGKCFVGVLDLVKTAIEVIKVKTISYALIEFNGCKVFIKKHTTEESAMEEYMKKLRNKHVDQNS